MLRNNSFRNRLAAGAILLASIASMEAASQKKVTVDFEDFGTWRIKDNAGMKPGALWPVDIGLSGGDAAKRHQEMVGVFRFSFDPESKGPFYMSFERQKMTLVSGFLDGIEFDADGRGFPVSVRFVIEDAAKQKFRTKAVALQGEGWQSYRIDLNTETVPDFAKIKFPARLSRVMLQTDTPITGEVYLDDITLTGRFAKKDQLSVLPIYDGITHLPDEPVTLRYRLRNALSEELDAKVQIEVRDFNGRKIHEAETEVKLPAYGLGETSFALGGLPIGAYEVAVAAQAGELKVDLQDHFGVFIPNNGRPNKRPMWFGVGDAGSWQGATETRRHLEWMKILGADVNRMEIFLSRFEPRRGLIAKESWGSLIKAHADVGIDLLILYSGVPGWTQTEEKWRGAPDKMDLYEEHARNLGAFLKEYPNVTYLEFWNEPDLEFFHGTLDDYLRTLEHFKKGFRQGHPDLPILSGGVTVHHPREKPGFSKGMYQQGAALYDIAAYHSHGPAINNERHQIQVEQWLKEAGVEKHYANTETGERSLYDVDGRKRQAITLVKKVVTSKAVPNFDLYMWFLLQDYWDMDPTADDSFGLITSDNRVKPSFVAYNALIQRLANTTPAGKGPGGDGLVLHAFRKDDGRYVYAGWPAASKSNGVLWVKTDQKVEVADMFGAVREIAPLGGVAPVPFGESPIYISGSENPLQASAEPERFLTVDTEVSVTGDGPITVPVTFRNPTRETLKGTLTLRDSDRNLLAERAFQATAGEQVAWKAEVAQGLSGGRAKEQWQLDLKLEGEGTSSYSFPIQLLETFVIKKVAALDKDPKKWPAAKDLPSLVVDRPEQVVELTYDPAIAAWKGPKDLSARAHVVHDGKGVRARIEVTDDTPGPTKAKNQLFMSDDVQLAFARPDAKTFPVLDVGMTAEGPVVWCSAHEDASRIGQWDVPVQVSREGSVTIYDVYLPFEKLGFPESGRDIRFAFLVNEDDGQGRVRWIQWNSGIGKDRSLEMLGHGRLE